LDLWENRMKMCVSLVLVSFLIQSFCFCGGERSALVAALMTYDLAATPVHNLAWQKPIHDCFSFCERCDEKPKFPLNNCFNSDCPMCLEDNVKILDREVLSCSHMVCKTCYEQLRTTPHQKKCPFCSQPFLGKPFSSKEIQELLKQVGKREIHREPKGRIVTVYIERPTDNSLLRTTRTSESQEPDTFINIKKEKILPDGSLLCSSDCSEKRLFSDSAFCGAYYESHQLNKIMSQTKILCLVGSGCLAVCTNIYELDGAFLRYTVVPSIALMLYDNCSNYKITRWLYAFCNGRCNGGRDSVHTHDK